MRAKTSKKDSEVRAAEVRKAASEGLLAFMEKMGNNVARDTGGSLVAAEIMLFAEGGEFALLNEGLDFADGEFLLDCAEKNPAMETLLKAVSMPYPSSDKSAPHAIDLPHTSRLYKTLLQGGHFCHTTKTISRSSSFSAAAFASAFMKDVGKEETLAMAKGNGAFMVAELCERIREEGSNEEKTMLKDWFSGEVMREIEEGDAKGKKVLVEKVTALSNL